MPVLDSTLEVSIVAPVMALAVAAGGKPAVGADGKPAEAAGPASGCCLL